MARDETLEIRVTAEEKAAFTAAAEHEGRTLSNWVRVHLARRVLTKDVWLRHDLEGREE
jgi:uncharacterized protein (DUF1778 family)